MITILIIVVTSVISFVAFNNKELFARFRFNPYSVKHHNQFYRCFTYGLIHADMMHLLVNMFVLYSFGRIVEKNFEIFFGPKSIFYFLLLYVGGIIFSVIYDNRKHGEDMNYNAVGASGAVSAVVFSSIIFYPLGKIYLYFIPIGIPSVIFGILYLVYSAYMAKKKIDNVGHNAHFYGAIFGVVFTILLKPALKGNS